MPIPNTDSAHVPPEKLTDYLLNEEHLVGGGKAKWFLSLGYDPAQPAKLEQDLLQLVVEFSETRPRLVTAYPGEKP